MPACSADRGQFGAMIARQIRAQPAPRLDEIIPREDRAAAENIARQVEHSFDSRAQFDRDAAADFFRGPLAHEDRDAVDDLQFGGIRGRGEPPFSAKDAPLHVNNKSITKQRGTPERTVPEREMCRSSSQLPFLVHGVRCSHFNHPSDSWKIHGLSELSPMNASFARSSPPAATTGRSARAIDNGGVRDDSVRC